MEILKQQRNGTVFFNCVLSCVIGFFCFSYIALGKLEDAVKLLFRRSDEVTLKLALDIAESVNNEELYKAVLVRYNAFKSGNKEEQAEANTSASEGVLDCVGSNYEEQLTTVELH